MIRDVSSAALAVFGWVFTLAIISVLVSKRANTAAVIQSTGSAVGNIIGQAVAPVSGGGSSSFGSDAVSTLHNISSGLSDANTILSYI